MKKNDTIDKKAKKIGWICPVCGLGNAPMALKCYHCPQITYTNKDALTTNKIC